MNVDSANKESSTGTTPTTAPANEPEGKVPAGEPPTLSESEYLEQQLNDARAAIRSTAKLIASNLGHTVDPRAWTRHHPVLSLGTAVASGFVAAHAIFPSAEKRLLRKLSAIERLANREVEERPSPRRGSYQRRSLVARLVDEAFKTVRPIAMSALASAMSDRLRRGAAAAEAADDNGKAATAPEPESPPIPVPVPEEDTSSGN